MKNVINIWKPIGITPLEAIQFFRSKNQEYRNQIISYAGRLDPMAEGVLILLIGEENKKREKYLDLDKEYEAEIVLGISTDTFDQLGIIESIDILDVNKERIVNQIKKFEGKQKQVYPPYSSKTVNGKPLYWWARNNKISEIKIPKHEIEIYSIKLFKVDKIIAKILADKIIMRINNIEGDFRQKDILKGWKKFKHENQKKELTKLKISVSCSSGTYIRRIASDLGEELGFGAFAYTIKRIRVGNIGESDCINLKV